MKTDKNFKKSVLTITLPKSFLTPCMGSSVNIALPAIQDRFRINSIMNFVESNSYGLSSGAVGTMGPVCMMMRGVA